ncbi:MAG: hypothetical protein ACRD0C_18560, partial [Acidimicrobiia bacterium]
MSSSVQPFWWLSVAAAAMAALLPPAAAAAAPAGIDGVYTVGESDLQGTRCSPTPFRTALAPGQTGPNYGYELRVATVSASLVSFRPAGGGTELFSATVNDDGTFSKEEGSALVEGAFAPNSRGEPSFTMEWIQFEAGGTCTTQFTARQTSAAPASGAPPVPAPAPAPAPAPSPPPVPFTPLPSEPLPEPGSSTAPPSEPLSEAVADSASSTAPPSTVPAEEATAPPAEGAASAVDDDGGGGSTGTLVAIAGVTVGTALIVTVVNGRRVRRRPTFKPRRKTASGALNVWDPTTDQQRRRWNEDQQVWDPDSATYRPARPEDLVDAEPLVPPPGMRAEDVPARCRPLYDLYVHQSEQQQWLETAIKDSEARHRKLELFFQQNKARALVQTAAPIVETALSVGTAGVTAARGGLVGATRAGVRSAAKKSAARLDDAMARRARLLSTDVEADPGVQRARALHTLYENKARNAEKNLPKAQAARAGFDEMEAEARTLRAKQGRAYAGKRPPGFPDDPAVPALPNRAALEQRIAKLKHELERLERPIWEGINKAEAELADVQRRLRINQEGTLGGRRAQTGKVGAQAYAADARQELMARQHRIQSELSQLRSKLGEEHLRWLDGQMRTAEAELEAHPGWHDLVRDEARATREAERALRTSWQLEDVTEVEVLQLRQLRDDAHYQLTVARVGARERLGRELRMLDEE